jgi:hypothetical protein
MERGNLETRTQPVTTQPLSLAEATRAAHSHTGEGRGGRALESVVGPSVGGRKAAKLRGPVGLSPFSALKSGEATIDLSAERRGGRDRERESTRREGGTHRDPMGPEARQRWTERRWQGRQRSGESSGSWRAAWHQELHLLGLLRPHRQDRSFPQSSSIASVSNPCRKGALFLLSRETTAG